MESKLKNTSEITQKERNSDEIRQDLAAKGEQFSRTVDELGERIEKKLDWREHMRQSPFLMLGAATGLGFLAARMIRRRATPMERFLGTLDSSVRGGLAGMAAPGLIKITLLGIVARTATHWLKEASSVVADGSDAEHRTHPEFDDGAAPAADRDR
jgi:hypothetical protein